MPPGTRLQGRYRIERVLGSGAFGRVYLATDTQDATNPSLAINELLDHQFASPADKHEAISWFKREVSTLLTLEHPGIPAIYGYWTAHAPIERTRASRARSTHERTDTTADRAAAPAQEAGRARRPGRHRGGARLDAGRQRERATLYRTTDVERGRPHGGGTGGHAAIVLPNGEVLVAGGYGADQLLASAEVFDPRTKQWQRTGAPPVPQAPTVALLLATGKVLLGVGGTGPPKPHDRPRALRSGARHVGSCPPAPLPAAVGQNAGWQPLTLTDVGGGRVLVLGVVRSPGRRTPSAYLYDARRDTWRAAPPPPLDEAAWALRLPSGQVLVIGTATVGGRYVWEAALYNPHSGTWTATPPPPNNIGPSPPVLLSTGKVLFLSADASCGLLALGRLVGGCDLTARAVLYDPRTGHSAATGSLTRRHVPDVVVALPNGTVLAASGLSKTSTSSGAFIAPVPDAEVYDPRTGRWSPTGSMATTRVGASAVVLPSGVALVSGGDGAGSAELYTGR